MSGEPKREAEGIVVCIPVFNDWEPAAALLAELGTIAPGLGAPCRVVIVDDGSTEPPPPRLPSAGLRGVEILRLRRNLGHQRAIAVGLSYIRRCRPCDAVVVMDGDGQDGAADVPPLLRRCRDAGWGSAVFARRTSRSEGLLFRVGYRCFRVLHRLLTGRSADVGNFSVLPFPLLERLVAVPELWVHYAAAVTHAGIPCVRVATPRRPRTAGRTRMRLSGLVLHGLRAIAVHGVTAATRLFALGGALLAASGAGALALSLASARGASLPAWVLPTVVVLLLGSLQATLSAGVLLLALLDRRAAASFLPLRDWRHFVAGARDAA